MRRLERRLECLEDARRQEEARLGRKALEYLSDEDLDALEDALEAGQEDGSATFEDLYRASSEQTRRVFRALADGSAEEPDRGRWHALQVWLEGGEHRVTIPYAEALAEKMGDVVVRLRRDFSVVLSLIKAHAILHQATRERDADGRIVATLGDYSRVRDLVSGLIAEGVEATVPKTVRETVEDVENVIDGWGEEHATNKAVAEELEIDKAAASRRVRTAIGRGYIKNLEDRKGHPAQLVLAEDMPEDQEILPAPEELEGVDPLTVDRGGIYYPPSPLGDPRRGRGDLIPLRETRQPINTGERSSCCERPQALPQSPGPRCDPRSLRIRRAPQGKRPRRRADGGRQEGPLRVQAHPAQVPVPNSRKGTPTQERGTLARIRAHTDTRSVHGRVARVASREVPARRRCRSRQKKERRRRWK